MRFNASRKRSSLPPLRAKNYDRLTHGTTPKQKIP